MSPHRKRRARTQDNASEAGGVWIAIDRDAISDRSGGGRSDPVDRASSRQRPAPRPGCDTMAEMAPIDGDRLHHWIASRRPLPTPLPPPPLATQTPLIPLPQPFPRPLPPPPPQPSPPAPPLLPLPRTLPAPPPPPPPLTSLLLPPSLLTSPPPPPPPPSPPSSPYSPSYPLPLSSSLPPCQPTR